MDEKGMMKKRQEKQSQEQISFRAMQESHEEVEMCMHAVSDACDKWLSTIRAEVELEAALTVIEKADRLRVLLKVP